MQLPISEDEIINLVKTNQIDSSFKYLDNPNVMYIAIKENPNLFELVETGIKERMLRLFDNDSSLDDNKKLILFKKFIYYFEEIPSKYTSLIKDLDTYLNLASDLASYAKLCGLSHNYKEDEKKLFFSKYEQEYIFNPENRIKYAKDSEIVLINTLKRSPMNIYFLSYFSNQALSDQVLEYIEKNNLTNNINIPSMYEKFPKLIILKLKKNLNFIFTISPNCIDDRIVEYLKNINFNINQIEEYISKYRNVPLCLKSSKLILYLVKENLDNIKYFDGTKLDNELVNYLITHDYIYKKGHNKVLLTNDLIYNNFLKKGDITILFHDDINLSRNNINLLIKYIKNNKLSYIDIKNKYLLTNQVFNSFIVNYLNLDNPYNLDNKYLITSLGISLNKLNKIFKSNDIEIIIREIVKNNYFIDINGIFNNISLEKFKYIYDTLSKKENKFNNNFDFYYFIKITDYLSHNLNLVHELNNNNLDDRILSNLSLLINRGDIVDYNTLLNYPDYLKEKILNDEFDNKAIRLLLNYDPLYTPFFLDDIITIPNLIYLQLDYDPNSLEYKVLDNYINILTVLKSDSLTSEVLRRIDLSSFFDINVIKKNILILYARRYQKLRFNPNNYKDRCMEYNNTKIIDITGSDFSFFVHDDNFNNQDDFTNPNTLETVNRNYLCTSFSSELFPYGMNSKMYVYDLEDENSLIAFGNLDININYLNAPLFASMSSFVNPIDMAFSSSKHDYVPNEFDFLRYSNSNIKLEAKYKVVNSMEEALKVKNYQYVLIFDEVKHKNIMKERYNNMCLNINNLSFNELYKLIALTSRYEVSEDLYLAIRDKIKELSNKEQIVLNDALDKYSLKRKYNNKNIGKH